MTNLTHHPLLVLLAQFSVMGYAVWALHHRNDRRSLPKDLAGAVHSSVAFATGILILSLILVYFSDGRRFLAVRQVFEVGYLASCMSLALVIRILKGQPHDRKDRGTP
jgi:hypothetical protein